jgi:hypothetical protein
VQLDLLLGGLDRVLVRMDGVPMGQMGVVARRFVFVVGQMLARNAVMRRGLFEVLRCEFVMIFQLLHFRLLLMG